MDVALEVSRGGYDGYGVFWVVDDFLAETFKSGRHGKKGTRRRDWEG